MDTLEEIRKCEKNGQEIILFKVNSIPIRWFVVTQNRKKILNIWDTACDNALKKVMEREAKVKDRELSAQELYDELVAAYKKCEEFAKRVEEDQFQFDAQKKLECINEEHANYIFELCVESIKEATA